MPNEKPIIMTGESIPAILKRLKTQTRRVIIPQPAPGSTLESYGTYACFSDGTRARCPYGPGRHAEGDILWVREAFGHEPHSTPPCPDAPRCSHQWHYHNYRADDGAKALGPWRSPRFMPRWASRITLEVVSVRVGRLQEISEEDARAEGVPVGRVIGEGFVGMKTYREGFIKAWDDLNARRCFPFVSNPWVWVVEFKLLEGSKNE